LQGGKTMIVQTIDDVPMQGWGVTGDIVVGAATVSVGASTLEECLVRCNVPTVVQPISPTPLLDNVARAAAVANPLILRFGFGIETVLAGTPGLDVEYDNAEDRAVFDALEDMRVTEQSIEWRIKLRWNDDTHRGFSKVLQIATKIGQFRPDTVFDLDKNQRGSIDSYTRTTSYADGKGATLLIGYSEGTGPARDSSGEVRAPDLIAAGWPVWEDRQTITGLSDNYTQADLIAATQAKLANMRLGRTKWTVVVNESGPRPAVDYEPGDTVTIDVAPQGARDPIGGTAQVRVIGYQYDLASRRTTPTFWDDADG
jgi:hypothetical protein